MIMAVPLVIIVILPKSQRGQRPHLHHHFLALAVLGAPRVQTTLLAVVVGIVLVAVDA